ncbi:MAG TPA: lysophospholipid acyltransferase family protein [Alphaproteobacteria bacterium]|nr:lysophospholipid acyltransferase family protein [Alphaproteobacteria bacterium]
MKTWLRALLFNAALYGWTAILSLVMMPTLLLPRRGVLFTVHLWLRHVAWIERAIGGLDYKVVGWENVPEGAAIIASKHQSAWETFKLHLLFGDPAVVLKKNLVYIPIWGWYLARSGVVAIDRAKGAQALAQMLKAAREVAAEGRKLVIFPQGTRLPPDAYRPYKGGVGALYEALNVPVVPMALNSGVFWPRNSFVKKPGTVTVEFLPPIPPGLPRAEMMKRLEDGLEAATQRLVREANK